jgi:serine/threonine-protein kinase RsbW
VEKILTVKSTTDNLGQVREFVIANSAGSGLSDEAVDKIVLAVDEACTNIIKHAYNNSPEGEIIIKFLLNNKQLAISLLDFGTNFDSKTVPIPDIKKYYNQHKVGGLGVYLMRKLMDEVVYDNSSKGKNKVTLIKYLA